MQVYPSSPTHPQLEVWAQEVTCIGFQSLGLILVVTVQLLSMSVQNKLHMFQLLAVFQIWLMKL